VESNRFWRQLEICPPDKLAFPITVIGAGAIGSAVVVNLAKMGCSDITVWDEDVLAEHNIPNQMCLVAYVNFAKVDALARLVEMLCGVQIKPLSSSYRGQRLEGVVISAVDSMTARQIIWRAVKMRRQVDLFIDARMGAQVARIYAIRPTDPDQIDFFESNLYASDEAEQLPCSARSIIYCPAIAAALIALLVKKHAVSQPHPHELLVDLTNFTLLTS